MARPHDAGPGPDDNTVTGIGASPPHTASGEFLPGQILAGRYRIVNLIGRGGMGEVYRADDLKLGQPVAIKFLPHAKTDDPEWLERLLAEVRVAHRISHPNVCRVHDVGEADGRHFLTMEFIDGEDLASLLRRIGRLPEEKALQIARQLCAGLAAAHDRGIIHRDLKPANVMIDERGIARITDFGLAGAARSFSAADVLHGTPAYMAPEQAAGREVTLRSDIYALGLVLHELCTGRRVSVEADIATSGTSVDPLVERAIRACLAQRPDARPASPQQVAAMLPGGDPLAAALAAGETPSPELVAGAAKVGSLSAPVAASLVVAVLVAIPGLLLLAERTAIHRTIAMPYSPAQLSLRAEQILTSAGGIAGRHVRYGFEYDAVSFRSVTAIERTSDDWVRVRAALREGTVAPLLFWYRAAGRPLVRISATPGSNDPPFSGVGESRVLLTPAGRLRRLESAPPPETAPGGDSEPDWAGFFRDAGLDIAQFTRVQPDWRPPLHADTVYRWNTTTAGQVRVAAASAGGSPVWFEVVPDDELPRHIAAVSRGVAERAFWGLIVTFYALVLAGALVLARRNVRLGRSDQRGGLRLAAFVFALGMLSWAFGGHHTATLEELRIVALAVAGALFGSACLLVGYLALEPIIRRRWPDRLISWSRVLAGDWRDPMAGRDVLVGTGLGLVMAAAQLGGVWIAFHSGGKQGIKMIDPETLEGIRGLAAAVVNIVVPPIAVSLSVLVFIVLISILVRRIGVATAAFAVLLTMVVSLQETLSVTQVAVAAVGAACFTLAIARVGLLAGVVAHLVFFLVDRFPLTLDVSVWYLPAALTPPLLIAALATFGAVTAVGGGRVFERLLPE